MATEYRFGRLLDSIVIVGYPGAGKGTLAKSLDREKFFHFSTGDMFREREDIVELQAILASGKLIPDERTLNMFYESLNKRISEGKYDPRKQYLVLDGIPRTLVQQEELKKDFFLKRVFYIDVPEDVARSRLKNRPGGRPEDKSDEAIDKRFEEYYSLTHPTLSRYDASIMRRIENNRPLEQSIRHLKTELRFL